MNDFQVAAAKLLFGEAGKRLSLVSSISPDMLDVRRELLLEAPLKNKLCACRVLDPGGMNDNAQQQSLRVNKNMSLASEDVLARIKARSVGSLSPPFLADFTVCESITAAEARGSRPSLILSFSCSASCIFCHVPLSFQKLK